MPWLENSYKDMCANVTNAMNSCLCIVIIIISIGVLLYVRPLITARYDDRGCAT